MRSLENFTAYQNRTSNYNAINKSGQRRAQTKVNVQEVERLASIAGGATLTFLGVTKGGLSGLGLSLVGAGVLWRGVSGHCKVYEILGVDTTQQKKQQAGVQAGRGIKVEKSVTINRPADEVYRYWHNFENLPRFMNHLEAVQVIDSKQSHWTAKAPLGMTVEWQAEIINDKENELIAWRSVEGSSIPNAGSVRFEKRPAENGTIVRVALSYEPPAGSLGATIAKLFGEEPEQQIEEDLRRFKQLVEAGETASVQGQSSGSKAASGSGNRR